jgi:integrase
VRPHWQKHTLAETRTIQVESWLRTLPLAKSSCAKIRNLMSVLFNHACRYEFFDRNPIYLVRQSAKRRRRPTVLVPAEIKALVDNLSIRERTLVLLAVSTGLRQSELFGLKWGDIDFAQRSMSVTRSIVYGAVGPCKTESSQKPVPIRPILADALLQWRKVPATQEQMIGFLPAGAAGDGDHIGDKRSYVNTFVQRRRVPESRSDSDGTRSGTRIQLC